MLRVDLVKEHDVGLHRCATFSTLGNDAKVLSAEFLGRDGLFRSCSKRRIEPLYRGWQLDLPTVILSLITAAHVVGVAMNLVDMRSEHKLCVVIDRAPTIFVSRKDGGLPYIARWQAVDVLSDVNTLVVCFLSDILLKLSASSVAWVNCLANCEFEKVVNPLPDSHWVLIEERSRQDIRWLWQISILFGLLPEAIVFASEGRDATRSADACACHYHELLAADHLCCSLSSSQLLGPTLVTISRFDSTSESAAQGLGRQLIEFSLESRDLLI